MQERLRRPNQTHSAAPSVETPEAPHGVSGGSGHGFSQISVLSPQQSAAPIQAKSGGQALPSDVKAHMESAMKTDFSDVRIHHGNEASDIGAVAYAQGNDLHFAPGKFDPSSDEGQALLGHELTHVVQQREGRVPAPQGESPINDDPALEAEADARGAAAAMSRPGGF